jgi:hypothetical protein
MDSLEKSKISENCALLGCYTASSGNSLAAFWILTITDGTYRLSWDFNMELLLLAAQ